MSYEITHGVTVHEEFFDPELAERVAAHLLATCLDNPSVDTLIAKKLTGDTDDPRWIVGWEDKTTASPVASLAALAAELCGDAADPQVEQDIAMLTEIASALFAVHEAAHPDYAYKGMESVRNMYGPGGFLYPHFDLPASVVIVFGLLGSRDFYVHETDEPPEDTYDAPLAAWRLGPGSVVEIDNMALEPIHSVYNSPGSIGLTLTVDRLYRQISQNGAHPGP